MKFTYTFLLGVLCWGVVKGQQTDSVPDKFPANVADKLFGSVTRSSQYLFNGLRYSIVDRDIDQHRFFETRSLRKGSVIYDGARFDSVPMLYDNFEDLLVVQQELNKSLVMLQKEKLEAFWVGNHVFEKIDSSKSMRPGNYEVLFEGKVRVLAKRYKTISEDLTEGKVAIKFIPKSHYFIFINHDFVQISNKRQATRLLDLDNGALRLALRNEGIKFKKEPGRALILMAKLFDNKPVRNE